MSEWSRRRALHAGSLGGFALLAGCQRFTGPQEPPRYAVEMRNYADRSTTFQVRVEGESDGPIWEFSEVVDPGRAVDDVFQGTPSVIHVTVDTGMESRSWERTDCGERQRASTAQIQYGANTEMDEVGVQFRCEDIGAKEQA